MRERVDVIIVPAPSVGDNLRNPFPDVLGEVYYGGKDRLRAGAKLYNWYSEAKYLLLGTQREPEAMLEFLLGHCPLVRRQPKEKIEEQFILGHTCMCSFHNWVGLFLQYPDLANGQYTAIVTNRYHVRRALLMWKLAAMELKGFVRIRESPAILLTAEDILGKKVNNHQDPAFCRRIGMEARGQTAASISLEKDDQVRVKDGRYQDSCFSRPEIIFQMASIVGSLKLLLTPYEMFTLPAGLFLYAE